MTRLDPEVFRLPVERIRSGWYSDAYLNQTKRLLELEGRDPHVTMQVFQRHDSLLGCIDEALAGPPRPGRRDVPVLVGFTVARYADG